MSYDINSNILTKTGLTAGQLQSAEAAIRGNNGYHADFWQALVDAENTYGLNSLFILAHADVESAHGTSNYAVNRNNLFGFNAVDSNPDLASSYSSQRDSVMKYADFLSHYYLYSGQEYWGGASTPHGIFVHYSSSHDSEATTVVGLMNSLLSHISGAPTPTPTPTTPTIPDGSTVYTVAPNDNMSSIAAAHGMTLGKLEGLNPNAGHPAGNYGVIWPGDKLVLGGTAPAPASNPQYYTVVKDDNLSKIAESNDLSLTQIEAMNPNAGHPAGNFGNIWPGDQVRVK